MLVSSTIPSNSIYLRGQNGKTTTKQQNKNILMYIDPQWQIWQHTALTKKKIENVLNKFKRMDHQQKNDKTRRVRGLGRKTRQEIGKK